jgi:hypothetical protein
VRARAGLQNVVPGKERVKATKATITHQFPHKVPADVKQNPDSLMFFNRPGIKPETDKDEESSGAISFLTTSAAHFASFDMSTTAGAFETFTPATGTYSWSEVVQQKTPPGFK